MYLYATLTWEVVKILSLLMARLDREGNPEGGDLGRGLEDGGQGWRTSGGGSFIRKHVATFALESGKQEETH